MSKFKSDKQRKKVMADLNKSSRSTRTKTARKTSFRREQLKEGYKQRYSNLTLTEAKNDEFQERYNGGYKYTVQDQYGRGVTAFRTDGGLQKYLQRTDMKQKLSDSGKDRNNYNLEGGYEKISMRGNAKQLNEFGEEHNMTKTQILSNGEYTTAYYKNGKIYYLNPNDPREVHEYRYE